MGTKHKRYQATQNIMARPKRHPPPPFPPHHRRGTIRPSRCSLLSLTLVVACVLTIIFPTLLWISSSSSSTYGQGDTDTSQDNISMSHSWSFYPSEQEPTQHVHGTHRHQQLGEKGPTNSAISLAEAIRRARYQYRPPQQPRTQDDWNRAREECGPSPDFGPFFAQSSQRRSLRKEDKIIYETFFKQYEPHTNTDATILSSPSSAQFTYAEIGAFNGMRESNSRFFDVCLGWRGILIEANPLKYKKLLQTRPHAHTFHFAASCAELYDNRHHVVNQTIGFHNVSFTNAAQYNVANAKIFKREGNQWLTQVPCGSMTPVLDVLLPNSTTIAASVSSPQQHKQNDVVHVNFFSLDVEGAEAMVLEHMDLTKLVVDIWIVENSNHFCQHNCPNRDRARGLLQEAGYIGYQDIIKGSDIFIRRNEDRNIPGTLPLSWIRHQLEALGVTEHQKLPRYNMLSLPTTATMAKSERDT